MNRVGKFEKVSYEQFHKDMKAEFYETMDARVANDRITAAYETVSLPVRATGLSAGYDLIAPFDFHLAPGECVKIPTAIRVQIDPGWFLMIAPRSGLGFKYRVRLANTIGVIDGDYYHSDNEGHIFCKVVNEGDVMMNVKAGEAFAQSIFTMHGITYDDNVTAVRNGGLGSTGK